MAGKGSREERSSRSMWSGGQEYSEASVNAAASGEAARRDWVRAPAVLAPLLAAVTCA